MVKPVGQMAWRAEAKRTGGKVVPEMKAVALSEFTPGHPGGDMHIHPSEMAKKDWCHRATCLRLLIGHAITDDTFNWVLETIFAEGHEVESKYQYWMRQTGKLWGTWTCVNCETVTPNCFEPGKDEGLCVTPGARHFWKYTEVVLSVPDLMIGGKEDGAMCAGNRDYPHWAPRTPDSGYLVECKTIGLGTYRADEDDMQKLVKDNYHKEFGYAYDKIWQGLARPFGNHVRQTNVYLALAELMGLPFTEAALLYEYKPNQQTKEFTVTKSAGIIDPILTKAETVVYGYKHQDPPECPTGGCEACGVYKEEYERGKASASLSEPGGATSGGRVQRRSRRARPAGNQGQDVGETAPGRSPGSPPNTRKRTRLRSDGPVSGSERVAEVPGDSVGGSGGGRTVRRTRRTTPRGAPGV